MFPLKRSNLIQLKPRYFPLENQICVFFWPLLLKNLLTLGLLNYLLNWLWLIYSNIHLFCLDLICHLIIDQHPPRKQLYLSSFFRKQRPLDIHINIHDWIKIRTIKKFIHLPDSFYVCFFVSCCFNTSFIMQTKRRRRSFLSYYSLMNTKELDFIIINYYGRFHHHQFIY